MMMMPDPQSFTYPMQQIMVIGCCGAGKSTFSKKLHAILQIPLIHLDQHFWKPNWEETDKQVWAEKVSQLAAQPAWIIDGNYGGTMDIRIAKADTIVFLDYPSWKSLGRVLKRITIHWGRERPDMAKGCRERFDWSFLRFVASYNHSRRPGILEKLAQHSKEKNIIIFRNDQQADAFLASLQDQKKKPKATH